MECKLIIRGRLPGLNQYIDSNRRGKFAGSGMKRKDEKDICRQIKSQLRGVRFDKPVFMSYAWYDINKQRDKDNISSYGRKVIQDSLVKCEVLVNDGWNNIIGFSDRFGIDKSKPRIEVIITDYVDTSFDTDEFFELAVKRTYEKYRGD